MSDSELLKAIKDHPLEKGQEFKNWPALCKALHLSVSAGDTKIARMRQLGRYYQLTRPEGGHAIRVDDVYGSPKALSSTNSSGVKKKNVKYQPHMEFLLLNDMRQRGQMEALYSKSQLFKLFGMAKPGFYSEVGVSWNERCQTYAVNSHEMIAFKRVFVNFTNSVLLSVIKSMERRNVISVEMRYAILKNSDIMKCDRDSLECENLIVDVEPDSNEHQCILNAEKEALSAMGMDDIKQLPFHRYDMFYVMRNTILRQRYDWQSIFIRYRITLQSLDRSYVAEKDLCEADVSGKVEMYQRAMNEIVVSGMKAWIERKYNKCVAQYDAKYGEFIPTPDHPDRSFQEGTYLPPPSYVRRQSMLVDRFVKLPKQKKGT